MLGKKLGTLGLCLLALTVVAQADEATRLRSLHWEESTLVMAFDGPYESSTLTLYDPDRLVLDFPEVRSDLSVHRYEGPTGVSLVRLGQNEADEPGGVRCRIVLDLASARSYLLEEEAQSLRLTLNEPGSQPAPSAPSLEKQTQAARDETATTHIPTAREETATPHLTDALDEEIELEAPPELPLVAEEKTLVSYRPLPAEDAVSDVIVATVTKPVVDESLNREAARNAARRTAERLAQLPEYTEPVRPDPQGEVEDLGEEPVTESESLPVKHSEAPVATPPAEDTAPAIEDIAVMDEPALPAVEQDASPEMDVKQASEETHLPEFKMLASSTLGAPLTDGEFDTETSRPVEKTEPAPANVAPISETKPAPASIAPVSETKPAPASVIPVAETKPVPDQAAPDINTPVLVKTVPAQSVRETPARTVLALADKSKPAKSEQPSAKAKPAVRVRSSGAQVQPTSLMVARSRVKPADTPISVELRGAEFNTLLRAFSEFSGQNIVSGRDVKGKVSVNLKQVPWREALASVCGAHGYGIVEEYGILRVAPRQILMNEEMELLTAEKKRLEYQPLETRIIKLLYAVASEITEPLSKMLSERGKMDVDSRTNSLLVTDLGEYVDQIAALARELDHLMPQVEITARIVDVDYRASRDLGIRWEAINLASPSADLTGSAVTNGTFPDPIGEFKLGTVRDFGELNMTIQALEKENKANIISNPRIMTMDNREANILVGKKIPLIVADEAGNAITQLTTIGIKLVVTPHINPDGQIMMAVHTEVSDLSSEATVQGGVIITTSESRTNVMVDNGETAVIGGLIKSTDRTTGSHVPWLGRIPILGHLFGYDNNSEDKRELIIFVTPRVVENAGEDSAAWQAAWEETPTGS